MPSVSIVCPHCETRAEIQITAVARSRPCPKCGESLMLQVAERAGGTKRKALLVAEVPPVVAAQASEDAFAQRQFEGEAFDRMRADPEVTRAGRKLFFGAVGVSALVVVVTVANVWMSWSGAKASPVHSEPAAVLHEVKAPEVREVIQEKPSHLPPMLSKPLDIERLLKERESKAITGTVRPNLDVGP